MTLTVNCSVQDLKSRDVWVLDIDNTLLPTKKAFAAFWAVLVAGVSRIAAEHGVLTDATVQPALEQTRDSLSSIFFHRRLDMVKALVHAYPGYDVNRLFAQARKDAEDAYRALMVLHPELVGALASLRYTKRKRLVAYTGGSPVYTAGNLVLADLSGYFDRVYCGAPHGWEDSSHSRLDPLDTHLRKKLHSMPPGIKRTTLGFEYVLQLEGIDGSDCLSVGDHGTEDVEFPQMTGAVGVLASWYERAALGTVVPQIICETTSDFLELVSSC